MESFYNELETSLTHLTKNIKNEKKLFQHNHQPVRFIVEDCLYCKIHGNILATISQNDGANVVPLAAQENVAYSIHYEVLD